MRARAHGKFVDAAVSKRVAGVVDLATRPDLFGTHLGVAAGFGSGQAFLLDFAGGVNSLAHGFGSFAAGFGGQFAVVYSGHFDVDIDAI